MLQVNQISRRYGSHLAVNQVSFSIQKGEIVGLLGHNGAGKTTIMKMISGYLDCDQGSITLDNYDVSLHRSVIQHQLGYLPEHLPLYPEMSVLDYLDYAAELKGLPRSTRTREMQRVIQATALHEKLMARIDTLSRGFKQRLGVAQAILGQPKLVILDEPTNGLDPSQTLQMRELIRQIAQDATVILSTHIMQEVQALCSRVLLIKQGELIVDRALKDLTTTVTLQLGVDCTLSQLQQLLSHISEVTAIQPLAHELYQLELASTADRKAVSRIIARCLIQAGAAIDQLAVQQQDLQSLFQQTHHENSQVQGGRHAA